jgi:hypothetical protein
VLNNPERSPGRIGVACYAQTNEEVVESPFVWLGGEAKSGGVAWKRHVGRLFGRGVGGDLFNVSR